MELLKYQIAPKPLPPLPKKIHEYEESWIDYYRFPFAPFCYMHHHTLHIYKLRTAIVGLDNEWREHNVRNSPGQSKNNQDTLLHLVYMCSSVWPTRI